MKNIKDVKKDIVKDLDAVKKITLNISLNSKVLAKATEINELCQGIQALIRNIERKALE